MVIQGEKKTIKLISWGPVLGSTALGLEVWQEIKKTLLEKPEAIILDFSKIRTVTGAFVLECFGKLLDELGPEIIQQRIVLQNANISTISLIPKIIEKYKKK